MRIAILVAVVALAGQQIPEQRVIPGRPIFVVSGQSNALPVVQWLAHHTLVRYTGIGGTPISVWDAEPHTRFQNDFQWVWPDLAAILSYKPMPDVFVWFHGESDATDNLIPHYYAAAKDLFRRVRALTKPDLLIVIVGLADYKAEAEHWDAIREIQAQLANEDPHALYFPTLTYRNDGGQHFADTAYEQMAADLFHAARERLGRTPKCVYDDCNGAVVPPWKPKP